MIIIKVGDRRRILEKPSSYANLVRFSRKHFHQLRDIADEDIVFLFTPEWADSEVELDESALAFVHNHAELRIVGLVRDRLIKAKIADRDQPMQSVEDGHQVQPTSPAGDEGPTQGEVPILKEPPAPNDTTSTSTNHGTLVGQHTATLSVQTERPPRPQQPPPSRRARPLQGRRTSAERHLGVAHVHRIDSPVHVEQLVQPEPSRPGEQVRVQLAPFRCGQGPYRSSPYTVYVLTGM